MTLPPILLIPGLGGACEALHSTAATMFPGAELRPFTHRGAAAVGGFDELADLAATSIAPHESVLVCAESFGGPVALTLARRYPERVRGLILMATFARLPSVRQPHAKAFARLWGLLADHAPLLAYVARVPLLPLQFAGPVGLAAARTYLSISVATGADYRHKLALLGTFDARPWLHEITCPCLIILGRRDLVVRPPASRELAVQLPNAMLHELPCGHPVYLAMPHRIREIVQDWEPKFPCG